MRTITIRMTGHCGFRKHLHNMEIYIEELIFQLHNTTEEDGNAYHL